MKLRNLIFLLSFGIISSLYTTELVVVIMIKNEATVIEKTLQPFVDAGVTRYMILDTGSTDGTVEVVQNFFMQHDLDQAYIKQEQFVDFATSRNVALDWAEKHFQDENLFFMIDAEWYVYGVKTLLNFCRNQDTGMWDVGAVLIKANMIDFYTPRLIRAHRGVRFVGVVHEVPNVFSREKMSEDIYIVYAPESAGDAKSRNRWLRDKQLLLHEVEKNHQDSRALFYLAQTCYCLGELQEAAYWYEQRCQVQGWGEENFIARYYLARVYEAMNDWDKAFSMYLQAYNMRLTRIEPLVRIARYYWRQKQYAVSYLFAYAACKREYPKEDVLFVDREIYQYERYNSLALAAWYIGEFEQGLFAVERALQAHPEYAHLHNNLSLYKAKLSLS